MGSGNVRNRYAYPLVAYALETPLSPHFRSYATMADGRYRHDNYHRHLPVCHSQYTTIHILPVLIDGYTSYIYHWHHRRHW